MKTFEHWGSGKAWIAASRETTPIGMFHFNEVTDGKCFADV